jgi:hypothetical protein
VENLQTTQPAIPAPPQPRASQPSQCSTNAPEIARRIYPSKAESLRSTVPLS